MNPCTIIIAHFVSDWMMQPRASAENKTTNPIWMGVHVGIIFVVFLLAFLLTNESVSMDIVRVGSSASKDVFHKFVMLCAINSGLHALIDCTIWSNFKAYASKKDKTYLERNEYAKDYWFYFTIGCDQMSHLLIAFYLFN